MNVTPKADDDSMMGMKDGEMQLKLKGNGGLKSAPARPRQQLQVEVGWSGYLKFYESIPREKLGDTIATYLLQVKPGVPIDLVRQFSDQSGRENFIRTATLQLMSLPEYQLC